MGNQEDYEKDDRKVLDTLNKAVDKGPWEKTLFLRAIGQKLKDLRDRFRKDMRLDENTEQTQQSPAHLAARVAERSGQVEVFISLYCATGGELPAWEKILSSMGKQVITRPTFRAEKDIRELIRTKINPKNEAYIAVYINKTDLLKPIPGKEPVDALGHQLLIVREGAVKANNITRFMHTSGRYSYRNGKLSREGDNEYSG